LRKWNKINLDAATKLREIAKRLAMKNIKKNREIKELNNTIHSLERLKSFDKTKFDRGILKSAIERYKKASGFDKHYGRCLLEELKDQGMARKGFEDTEEFSNWLNAFKWYRHAKNSKSKANKSKIESTI
jgi:hypothetical protein